MECDHDHLHNCHNNDSIAIMVPLIHIDLQSKEPIYRQIIEQVRQYVASEVLAPGDELPSLRQLAIDLNIHLNTVALAYRELERQGIIRLRQGARATILAVPRDQLAPPPQAMASMREQLQRVRTAALLAGISMAQLRAMADEIFADS